MSARDQATSLYIPAMRGFYDRFGPCGWPIVRIVTGLFMLPHGAQKLFGWFGGSAEAMAGFYAQIGLEPALPLVYASGFVEFFGGLLLVLGLFTRPAAAATAVLMLVAVFKVHLASGFFWPQGGYEYPLMWACLAVAVFLKGGGRYSLDRRIGREF